MSPPRKRSPHPPPLPPEFALAWSVSRSKSFRDCERSVFWSYFGSRGLGLATDDEDPEREAARAWALKHLTALPLVLGIAIHNSAASVLAALRLGGELPAYDGLLAAARATLNQVWRSSQPDLIDRFWSWPGVHPALREVVYRGALRPAEIERARWTLTSCLRHLLTAPVWDDLRACSPSEIWVPDGGPVQFRVPAVVTQHPTRPLLVWAAPDLCYVHGDAPGAWQRVDPAVVEALGVESDSELARAWCVADWKTGSARETEERLQLATYALWLEASGRPSVGGYYLGRVLGLRDASERWYAIGPEDRAVAQAVMAEDTARLLARMADPDRAVPKPRAEWALARDRRTCGSCNFLALCERELPGRRPVVPSEGVPPAGAATSAPCEARPRPRPELPREP